MMKSQENDEIKQNSFNDVIVELCYLGINIMYILLRVCNIIVYILLICTYYCTRSRVIY